MSFIGVAYPIKEEIIDSSRSNTYHDSRTDYTYLMMIGVLDANGLKNAFYRLSHISSKQYVEFLISLIFDGSPPLFENEFRMLNMLYYSLYQKTPTEMGFKNSGEFIASLRMDEATRIQILRFLIKKDEELTYPEITSDLNYDLCLDLHRQYSQPEILAAFNYWNWDQRPEMHNGELYLPGIKTDIIFVTIKTSSEKASTSKEGNISFIDRKHLYWRPKSILSAESSTGIRYQNSKTTGNTILLFVRQQDIMDGRGAPYIFLGKIHYQKHFGLVSMNIAWELEFPVPETIYTLFAETKSLGSNTEISLSNKQIVQIIRKNEKIQVCAGNATALVDIGILGYHIESGSTIVRPTKDQSSYVASKIQVLTDTGNLSADPKDATLLTLNKGVNLSSLSQVVGFVSGRKIDGVPTSAEFAGLNEWKSSQVIDCEESREEMESEEELIEEENLGSPLLSTEEVPILSGAQVVPRVEIQIPVAEKIDGSNSTMISVPKEDTLLDAYIEGVAEIDVEGDEQGRINLDSSVRENNLMEKEAQIETELTSLKKAGEIIVNTPINSHHISTSGDKWSNILNILYNEYNNGFRAESKIALKNFYKKYSAKYGDGDLPSEFEILNLLSAIGVQYNGKYYIISESNIKRIKAIIDNYSSKLHYIIYYYEFYLINCDFLNEIHIFSPDVLKLQLQRAFPKYYYYNNYFMTKYNAVLGDELQTCFSNRCCLTYDLIKEQIPYIPINAIKLQLSSNCNFVRVRNGEFADINKIIFDDDEVQSLLKWIQEEIDKNSFVSLSHVSFDESLGKNPELTDYAIRDAIYLKYLRDKYDKKGPIISKYGEKLDTNKVLKDYLSTLDSITETDLLDYMEEVTGQQSKRVIAVAYESMIRVNKELFIKPTLIHFDVQATDRAIALFAGEHVIPIKEVTSFTSFPYVDGYNWNLYLLESYCRTYSIAYGYDCIFPNSNNIGAIYPRNKTFSDIIDILSVAIVSDNVNLTPDDVGNFLSEKGYMQRRSANIIDKIIIKAQAIVNQGPK